MHDHNKKRGIGSAIILAAAFCAANVFAQDETIAYIPVRVNAAAVLTVSPPSGAAQGVRIVAPEGGTVTVGADEQITLALALGGSDNSSIRHNSRTPGGAKVTVGATRGGVSLDLSPASYQNAVISVYSVNGRKILGGKASARNGALSISRANIAAGAYLLSVRGINGNSFSSRLTHTGGKMSISVTFGKAAAAALAKSADVSNNDWTITAVPTGSGYLSAERVINPDAGNNPEVVINMMQMDAGSGGAVTQTDWTPTAAIFAIVEKTSAGITNDDVKNVDGTNAVISWNLRADAVRYVVYRDGKLLREAPGNMMEDYDLTVGQTYEYVIAGYTADNKVMLSMPVTVTAFAATAAPGTWRYKNKKSDGRSEEATVTPASGAGSPGGVKGADGKYYEFSVTGGSDIKTFQYRVSSNGMSGWSNWTNLPASPNGGSALTVGSWVGNLNGTPTTINPGAYVASGTTWNGSGDQAGVKLEGVHWYRVHDRGLVINGTQEGKYVLGCHREPAGNYNLAHIMLVSFYPNNGAPYGEITYSGRPFGFESRDQRIFVDTDGTAYALCSALGDSHIFKLDPQWKEPIEHTNQLFKGASRETPDIMRYGDWYFNFSSLQSGWYPSQAKYAMTRDIGGKWSELKEFGNRITFGAQFNGIRADAYGDGKTAYGFYSYRWSNNWQGFAKEDYGNPRRFAILNINGDYVSSHWFNNIVYYPAHGYVGIRPGKNLSLGKTVTAPPTQKQEYLQAVTDGMETESAPMYRNEANSPHRLDIDLETPSVIREIVVTTRVIKGSECVILYTISGSEDGNEYTQLADASQRGALGFEVYNITDTNKYRYIRLSVSKIIDTRPEQNNVERTSWADGIYEVAVYGTPQ